MGFWGGEGDDGPGGAQGGRGEVPGRDARLRREGTWELELRRTADAHPTLASRERARLL